MARLYDSFLEATAVQDGDGKQHGLTAGIRFVLILVRYIIEQNNIKKTSGYAGYIKPQRPEK